MTPDPDYDLSDPGLWTTNHGNFLLIFVGIIFLIGGGILFYQQNLMFQRPRFPDSDNIQTVMTNDASRLGTVLIRILGAANDEGTMKIAIYGAEYTFERPAEAAFATVERISGGEVLVPVPLSALPDTIAIAVFHDENDDGILNKNVVGFPSERYGFSRNARGLTGPPTWEQTVISRPANDSTVEIFVR